MPDTLLHSKRKTIFEFVVQHRTKVLIGILVLGLALRLFFTFFLADKLHYLNSVYVFPDTKSFTESFINYWERGKYTHDTEHPEAAFGRLPGYPVFYGIHYVIFGRELSMPTTAVSQILLDVLACYLLYRILKKITTSERQALGGAFIYSTYPFLIYWVPYICTETVACFMVILWVYQLSFYNRTKWHYILTGLICAVGLFIRVYLGILIVLTFISYLIHYRNDLKSFIRMSLLSTLGFMLIYIGWPIRNYVQFDKIILMRPSSAGYASYSNDMVGYTAFYHCWSQDDNAWYDSLFTRNDYIFPDDAFATAADKELAGDLLAKMKACGTSYHHWMYNIPYPSWPNCNEEVHDGFIHLRNQFIKHRPYTYFVTVPARNFKKAFFKMQPEKPQQEYTWLYYTAFSYRSLMVILGFLGLFYLREYKLLLPVFLFSVFMYVYICCYHRSLEMRYILQADVILLIPATIMIGKLYERFFKRQKA